MASNLLVKPTQIYSYISWMTISSMISGKKFQKGKFKKAFAPIFRNLLSRRSAVGALLSLNYRRVLGFNILTDFIVEKTS